MKANISFKKLLYVFLLLCSSFKTFSQCFDIESILVAACTSAPNSEGLNEMVRFKVGAAPVNTTTMSVTWATPGVAWLGLIQNATTASKVAALNAGITAQGGCGQLLEPVGGIIPANAEVILLTSYNFSLTANVFGAISQNIYILFQDNPSDATGHFGNYNANTTTPATYHRTFSISFGPCSDTVTYERYLLANAAGATINYTPAGVATYTNPGCVAPVEVFSVDAGTTPVTACPGDTIALSGTAVGYTTVAWSAPAGSFSTPASLATNYTLPSAAAGSIILTLTATNTCGTVISDNVTLNVNASVTPTFNPVTPICSGDALTPLPTTSLNGVTGSWSPSLNSSATTLYNFTPDASQCAVSTNLTITVNPIITPTFNPITICSGSAGSPLPTVSTNGISGFWSPAFNNSATTTYLFVPSSGTCVSSTSLTVLVNPANTIPAFNAVSPICAGDAITSLPLTSVNGITGTWSPALNNAATTTYTFTPTAGQCALPGSLVVTVNSAGIVPAFNAVPSICAGSILAPLPTTSVNGITGSWSPSINNTATTLYTFTPNAGQCAVQTTLSVTINPMVVPIFTQIAPTCSGTIAPTLPITSLNGITGTWSPAVSNTITKTYTFTPTAGQCAITKSMTITVSPIISPLFSAVASVCSGSTLSPLPTTSTNGIAGIWSPALNNTATTVYTFTPAAGQCAQPVNMTIAITSAIFPTFNSVAPICPGSPLAALPTNSLNGITGIWSPVLNNTVTTTYTFTPNAGQCASIKTMVIIVKTPTIVPTFNPIAPVCAGMVLLPLPTFSNNGISGIWSPPLNNLATTTYTFTPDAGQCAKTNTLIVTVNNIVVPNFLTALSLCNGSVAPILNNTSPNGISGSWSPPAIDNTASATYTFTPNAGQCASIVNLAVTVTDNIVTNQQDFICFDGAGSLASTASIKTNLSPLQYTFSWALAGNPLPVTANYLDVSVVGLYSVVATNIITGCTITILADVTASPQASASAIVSNDFDDTQQILVTVTGGLGNYEYQLNNGPFQSSNVFYISDGGEYTIHVKDLSGCNNFILHVTALNYPRFFTPNGDGYNDTWNIAGLPNPQDAEIYIFDRYGKLLKDISVSGRGWDGIYNQHEMAATDYWFKLRYKDKDGNSKEFKAHFSLKR